MKTVPEKQITEPQKPNPRIESIATILGEALFRMAHKSGDFEDISTNREISGDSFHNNLTSLG